MPVVTLDRTRINVADGTDVVGPEESDLLEKAFEAWAARRRKTAPISEKVALRAVWAELIADDPSAQLAENVRGLSDLAQRLDLMRLATEDEPPAIPAVVAAPGLAAEREDGTSSQRARGEPAALAASGIPKPANDRLGAGAKFIGAERQPNRQLEALPDRLRRVSNAGPPANPPDQQAAATPSEGGESTAPKRYGMPVIDKAWGAHLRVAAALALVLISVGVAQLIISLSSKNTLAAERAALDARALELTSRATRPNSALACLDGVSGDTVEAFCEKALFATPETVTASMSYVSAQLSLLADAIDYVRRGGTGFELVISNLRHAAEIDRFGIVAHVLAQRDGCTPRECRAFALLSNTGRVSSNLAEATFERTVGRYTESWPAVAGPPPNTTVAANQPPAAAAPPSNTGGAVKPPRRDIFIPSASSIPRVSIMLDEPVVTRPDAPATARTPVPPARRPAAQ